MSVEEFTNSESYNQTDLFAEGLRNRKAPGRVRGIFKLAKIVAIVLNSSLGLQECWNPEE